ALPAHREHRRDQRMAMTFETHPRRALDAGIGSPWNPVGMRGEGGGAGREISPATYGRVDPMAVPIGGVVNLWTTSRAGSKHSGAVAAAAAMIGAGPRTIGGHGCTPPTAASTRPSATRSRRWSC